MNTKFRLPTSKQQISYMDELYTKQHTPAHQNDCNITEDSLGVFMCY